MVTNRDSYHTLFTENLVKIVNVWYLNTVQCPNVLETFGGLYGTGQWQMCMAKCGKHGTGVYTLDIRYTEYPPPPDSGKLVSLMPPSPSTNSAQSWLNFQTIENGSKVGSKNN